LEDWQQDFADLSENDLSDAESSGDEEWDEDEYDGWGAIRPRRDPPRRR
jgi:hypothetical protein